ncbi:hypothetical protein ABNG03_01255 [Halorubrum sp. RMP-47]|uniref:DoxX family protein n=1 Tax=Halorubrum miltondacostae TaxID=3076378 RepID=A0ABD5M0S9_9EURY
MRGIEIARDKIYTYDRAAAIGAAEVVGAIALVVTTFTVPAFADMALVWRVLAVFTAIEGGNRLYSDTGF